MSKPDFFLFFFNWQFCFGLSWSGHDDDMKQTPKKRKE